jgi:HD-GYP domain-containing protein (c-di-GMP phosphodiesterase class II)
MYKMSNKPSQDSDLMNDPFDDSSSLVETIFQAFPDLLFHLDLEGRIVDYIAGNSSALYTTPENFLGHKMVEVLPEGVASLFSHAIAETVKSGQITSLEYDLMTPAGFRCYEAKCIRRSSLQIIVVVRDITGLKDAEALGRKQLGFMTALYQSAQELSKQLDSRELGKYITHSCVEKFGVELAWIGSLPAHRPLQTITYWPDKIEPANILSSIEPTSTELDTLVKQKTHLMVETQALPPEAHKMRRAFFPLISHDEVIGILGLATRQPDFFTPDRINFFYAYSSLAASAMENASLFEDSNRRLSQIQALRSIDLAILSALDLKSTAALVLKEVARQIDVDALNLLVLDPQTKILNSIDSFGFKFNAFQHSLLQVGENFGGLAALEKQIVHIKDLQDLNTFPFADEGFTTYVGVRLIARNEVKGVLEIFQRRNFGADQDWLNFLETIANQIALAIDNSLLLEVLHNSNVELGTAYEATIEGLSRALELRDRETQGHTRRVTEIAMYLARQMGVPEADLTHIRQGGLMHDIGKMGIPDAILLKPTSLTPQEWEIMRQHPMHAYEVLSQIEYFKPALDIPLYHHEKWDGSGYPHGLKGEEIPLAARIFSVVDVYDALTSDRPYRPAWTGEKTLDYIRAQAGIHFDQAVVEAFMTLVNANNVPGLMDAPAKT